MLTQAMYIKYLLSTPGNYTCTHLVEHLLGASHDQVNRFLRSRQLPADQLRALEAVIDLLRHRGPLLQTCS